MVGGDQPAATRQRACLSHREPGGTFATATRADFRGVATAATGAGLGPLTKGAVRRTGPCPQTQLQRRREPGNKSCR